MSYKPILFNTEMVKAIREGRKTQTRRIIKDFAGERITSVLKPDGSYGKYGTKGWQGMLPDRGDGNEYCIEVRPPCEPGDILWVRETWAEMPYGYVYRADDEKPYGWDAEDRWKPSIHMPKEAARIFLRVKDVRVERLQGMRLEDCLAEGVRLTAGVENDLVRAPIRAREWFSQVWDSTIKPADRDMYGWDANPWVWVIEFERREKPVDWR